MTTLPGHIYHLNTLKSYGTSFKLCNEEHLDSTNIFKETVTFILAVAKPAQVRLSEHTRAGLGQALKLSATTLAKYVE